MLDPDRLLWSFRKTAGLPTPGQPYVVSWEDPGCELRGHFVGHYLSAVSMAWAATGNFGFKDRLDLMVNELRKVQQAIGSGYLSAFPTELFDRVEALKPVWAPYYTIHKIIAGLVDAYEMAGNTLALDMAKEMVAYHWNRSQALIKQKGADHWTQVLNTEFGGMNEILYRLYSITSNPDHMAFAKLFEKRAFREPMERGNDVLPGLHANTHLAQVAGFAMAYDVAGDEAARTATLNFFNMVTEHHSYATGGSNDHEFWQAADNLAGSLWKAKDALETQETCTQYNILKIARSLFRWTGDVRYADYYERALVNGILGTARLPPEDWPEAGGWDHHHHHHHHHHHSHLRSLIAGGQQHHTSHQGVRASTQQQAAAAVQAAGGGASVTLHRREHNDEWLPWWAFTKPRPEWNASDAHGPGVFIYLLPLGTGQSKSDNIHHWGFPFHSFWCCYGTVVESYSKLADSIYFRDMNPGQAAEGSPALPPRLYLNQFVSSRLSWRDKGVQVTVRAEPFAPGPAVQAEVSFAPLGGDAFAAATLHATLMVRVPEYTLPAAAGAEGGAGAAAGEGGGGGRLAEGGPVVEVNGAAWSECPGPPQPGSYCQVTREWGMSDTLSVRLPLRWWTKPLPEVRPEYQGLQAVMMGPHVMAGITHEERTLLLPREAPGGPPDVASHVYPPEEADELLSLQAGWNASLSLRHDNHLAFVSHVEDGGDAMDATFRLGRGCHHGQGHRARGAGRGHRGGGAGGGGASHHGLLSELHGAEGGGGEGASHDRVAGVFGAMHRLMRMGQHDSGQVSLEAMNYPNHYIAHDHAGVIVLQPGSSSAGDIYACAHAGWMMRPGLDGQADTVSFEAADRPDHYITALAPAAPPLAATATAAQAAAAFADACSDDPAGGELCMRRSTCTGSAYAAQVLCRRTCERCNATRGALRLQQGGMGDPAFAAAASFRLAPPARRAYPAGSYILAGSNRHYLLAPLGNLVDERYTAYFAVEHPGRTKGRA